MKDKLEEYSQVYVKEDRLRNMIIKEIETKVRDLLEKADVRVSFQKVSYNDGSFKLFLNVIIPKGDAIDLTFSGRQLTQIAEFIGIPDFDVTQTGSSTSLTFLFKEGQGVSDASVME
ncbi:hypothetical protein [Methanobacterium paludis]|uniref:Uncharacterized protein n=1 Tax=Methanobacterium paludis (strain DSM 25820 / JCM 18151 / SWAN1) TaxID=868131 RepID=F6D3A1_METPW|nr:hypothetical protein [Methanobacterium paludis]AEG18693.1 hypothetical protein MSWAN_1682 [Methanobacterium paludis]